jgi:glycosyltransferase involved in cell wall biosynthesis
MKILVVSNYFTEHAGGIEYVASNLVSCLRNTNLVHWIACDVKNPSHKVDEGDIPLDSNNYAEIKLGFPYPLPSLNSIPQIIREIQWSDVIHLHDCLYFTNVLVFVISRFLKKPVLITQHISPVHYGQKYKNALQWIAYRTIGRFVIENSEKVVFISERVQTWFCERMKLSQKSILMMNGIDRTIFFPPSAKKKKRYARICIFQLKFRSFYLLDDLLKKKV